MQSVVTVRNKAIGDMLSTAYQAHRRVPPGSQPHDGHIPHYTDAE